MLILLGTVFIASLLGSLHCVGMCGPFALLAGADSEKRTAAIGPTLFYSGGRLVTYSIVGLIFGVLGMALNKGTSFASWQQSATYVAGGLMILVGLITLARIAGCRIKLPQVFSPVQKFLQSNFSRATKMKPLPRAFAIGALTSLMPCGWLYTFAIAAAGTGSPWWGIVLMATFWLGTVPIMTALMLGFSKIGQRLQAKVPVIMACLVVLLGMFTVAFRAPIAIGADTRVASDIESVTSSVSEIDQETLPCCQDE